MDIKILCFYLNFVFKKETSSDRSRQNMASNVSDSSPFSINIPDE